MIIRTHSICQPVLLTSVSKLLTGGSLVSRSLTNHVYQHSSTLNSIPCSLEEAWTHFVVHSSFRESVLCVVRSLLSAGQADFPLETLRSCNSSAPVDADRTCHLSPFEKTKISEGQYIWDGNPAITKLSVIWDIQVNACAERHTEHGIYMSKIKMQ